MDLSDVGTGNESARMPLIDPRTNKQMIHAKKKMFIQGFCIESDKFDDARKIVSDKFVGARDINIENAILAESVEDYQIFYEGKWAKGADTLAVIFAKYKFVRNQYFAFVRNELNFLAKLPRS